MPDCLAYGLDYTGGRSDIGEERRGRGVCVREEGEEGVLEVLLRIPRRRVSRAIRAGDEEGAREGDTYR